MYNNKFCEIYDKYGWDYFSITMGDAILKYFDNNKIKIKTNIDLCCGVGTLCDFFHNKGIKTTGIDISSSMIKIAKEKYPSIDFFQKNVCTYADNNKYDLVTCTCDAINHIKNIEAIKKTI